MDKYMKQQTDIETLFRAHYAKMYRLARRLLCDGEECRDVVSEVFAALLDGHVALLPGQAEGYLMRSVRNRCLNLLAHKSVQERTVKMLSADAARIEAEDDDERLERLMRLIEGLEPPLRREILRLRFLEEMTYGDIARHEGVSKVTVYNHLSAAIDFIREHFNPCRQ